MIFFKKIFFGVLIALFAYFKCKCEKNCTFSNILQKSYFFANIYHSIIPFHRHQYERAGCITFHRQQCEKCRMCASTPPAVWTCRVFLVPPSYSFYAGTPDRPASDHSGTGMDKNTETSPLPTGNNGT
jgi:hypothetical protein